MKSVLWPPVSFLLLELISNSEEDGTAFDSPIDIFIRNENCKSVISSRPSTKDLHTDDNKSPTQDE